MTPCKVTLAKPAAFGHLAASGGRAQLSVAGKRTLFWLLLAACFQSLSRFSSVYHCPISLSTCLLSHSCHAYCAQAAKMREAWLQPALEV